MQILSGECEVRQSVHALPSTGVSLDFSTDVLEESQRRLCVICRPYSVTLSIIHCV